MRPLLIAGLAACSLWLAPPAQARPGAQQVRAELRAQLGGSNKQVRLDVAGLSLPLTLEGATETGGGQFRGKARFGPKTVQALLHFVAARPGSDQGAWVLSLALPIKRFSDVAPHWRGSVVDQLDLTNTIVAFSLGRVSALRGDLDSDARAFYGKYAARALELEKGINLVTAATPRRGTLLARSLGLVGLGKLHVNLRGVLLRGLKLGALKEARDQGRLSQALQRDTELRASLPHFKLPGLPRSFATSSAYLSVTGEPGVGVGFALTLGQGRSRRSFDCKLKVRKTQAPAGKGKGKGKAPDTPATETEVTIVAGAQGRWSNAFGISGFHLDQVRLLLSVDTTQQIGFGLRAALQVGRTPVMIAGKLKLHAVTGAATGGIFAFRIGSLSSADLIAFANAVGDAQPHPQRKRKRIGHGGIPAFRLVDVAGRFAPLGGDPDLGIPRGIAIRGKLFALKRRLLAVDATLDQSTLIPTIRVWGRSAKLNLGALALDQGSVDIKLGVTLDPYFRAKGGSRLLGAYKRLDVDISRRRFRFELLDKVAGVYEAHWKASSPSRGKPSWNLDVVFKNHFHRTLERDVSRQAVAWANKTQAEFRKADQGLKRAQGGLVAIDRKIAVARREVRAKRARKKAALDRAIAEVRRLDGAIAARRKEVAKRHAPLRKAAAKLKKKRDAAVAAWRAAVKRRKKAKGLKKAGAKTIEAAAFTKKTTLQAEYGVLNGKLLRALSKTDAKLAALHTARGTALAALKTARFAYTAVTKTPVDADPKIVGLFTQKKTAQGALITARALVKTTGAVATAGLRVSAWAAKHHGAVFKLHRASFSTRLNTYVKGSRIKLQLRISALGGKPQTHTLTVGVGDLRKGRVFGQVWKLVRPSLKTAAKAKKKQAKKRAKKRAKKKR